MNLEKNFYIPSRALLLSALKIKPTKSSNKLLEYSANLLTGFIEDIKKTKIKRMLILGDRQSFCFALFKSEFNTNVQIEYLTASTRENSYDLVVSFFDLNSVINPKLYCDYINSLLNKDGVFIGCFFGGQSFMNLRKRLLDLDFEFMNKYPMRLNPMIKIDDFTGGLNNIFKNVISFQDEVNFEFQNVYELISEIKNFGENKAISGLEKMNKHMYQKIKYDSSKHAEKIDILAFCASKTSKLLASKVVL
jgi:hypothetical protein